MNNILIIFKIVMQFNEESTSMAFKNIIFHETKQMTISNHKPLNHRAEC